MANILMLFLCLLLGYLFQRVKAFPSNTHQVLNQFVIWISLPALVLFYMPKVQISSDLIFPLSVAWIGFFLSWIFFTIVGKYLRFSRKLTGALILMGGLGNTSFVGFPIIQALYGKEGIATAVVLDQPGTFLVMGTLGLFVAATYSKGTASVSSIASKILTFPPFLAFVFSISLNLLQLDFPSELQKVFENLGATVTPLALVAVGYQLRIQWNSKHWGMIGLGLFFKLMFTPLFFYLLFVILLKQSGLMIEVCVMEAAMAPMVTAGVLCLQYGLKPKMAATMLGIGIPLSLITLCFWYWILN